MGALSPEQVSLWGLLAAGGLGIAPISFGSCTQGGEHSGPAPFMLEVQGVCREPRLCSDSCPLLDRQMCECACADSWAPSRTGVAGLFLLLAQLSCNPGSDAR